MSFRIFGQVIVVLSSFKAAKDLLERNGEVYSDRPVVPFFEMCVVQSVAHDMTLANGGQDAVAVGFGKFK